MFDSGKIRNRDSRAIDVSLFFFPPVYVLGKNLLSSLSINVRSALAYITARQAR